MTVATPSRQLSEAILDSGIQNTNYFNGRILNAGDLQTDQEANRQQHEQFGTAIGAGIAQGLWVELISNGNDGSPPVVAVSKGLALNGNGEAVSLPLNVQVALARQTTPAAVSAGLFADCTPPSTASLPAQAGIYILTVCPASGFAGQAPSYSFGDVGAATGCGYRYAVEGVSFGLVQLNLAQITRLSAATQSAVAQLMTQTDAASLSLLRNWIAHICFGTEERAGFLSDPFARTSAPNGSGGTTNESPYLTYGAIDALLASGALSACEVPLALLYWTVQGVQFLDRWSVRRETVPRVVTSTWPLPLSVRRRREAEAEFLQFEEQIAAVIALGASQSVLSAIRAVDYFRYLPPMGLLPTAGFGAAPGFDPIQFFATHTTRNAVFIEGALLSHLLQSSLSYPPVDLSDEQLIWLYTVRENMQAVAGNIASGATATLVFATGHIPYLANAHYDLSRWNYANFALGPQTVITE